MGIASSEGHSLASFIHCLLCPYSRRNPVTSDLKHPCSFVNLVISPSKWNIACTEQISKRLSSYWTSGLLWGFNIVCICLNVFLFLWQPRAPTCFAFSIRLPMASFFSFFPPIFLLSLSEGPLSDLLTKEYQFVRPANQLFRPSLLTVFFHHKAFCKMLLL